MATLFEKTLLKDLVLANRLVRSATWEGMADQFGRPTEQLNSCYQELAQGGIGLLISGNAYVSPEGQNMPYTMGIDRDDLAPDYASLVDAVHKAGSKLVLQMIHAGGQTESSLVGQQPVAPSSVATEQFPQLPRELSRAEITTIILAFREGARRAKEWGFDGVQFHAGHGYLISQFLSPHTNRRTDEYGGSLENRCRFVLETYRAVREEVGDDFPVLVKMNITDNLVGGLEIEDGIAAARMLAAAGIDAIEVSAGTMVSGEKIPTRLAINRPEQEAYHLDLARWVKAVVSCPVIVVGGFRSYAIAEAAIRESGLDFVALSRPLIMEPGLPNRWRQGDLAPAGCISCNGCLQPGMEGTGISCVLVGEQGQ